MERDGRPDLLGGNMQSVRRHSIGRKRRLVNSGR